MNKQAQAAGEALAQTLLTKLASAGDMTTMNGIPSGVVPLKSQLDTAQLVAEDDSKIKPMPTGDGQTNSGTINQILDGIVNDAMSQGAASFDQVHTTGVAAQEGVAEDLAMPNQVQADETEKAAAVSTLVGLGMNFDEAVGQVKLASDALDYEQDLQIKQAAIGALIDRGVDFNVAVNMVKSAGVVDAGRRALLSKAQSTVAHGPNAAAALSSRFTAGKAQLSSAVDRGVASVKGGASDLMKKIDPTDRLGQGASYVRGQANAASNSTGQFFNPNLKNPGGSDVVDDFGNVARKLNKGRIAGAAGVGALAVGGGAYAATREKKAAFDALVDSGVDFDLAAALVSEKAQELYGA